MSASFVAYGFEQLNDIRDYVIEAEKSGDSQEVILSSLKDMFVDMTDESNPNTTVSEFVSALFVSSMKIAYNFFAESDDLGVSECAEVISQMAMYSKDLSSFVENEETKKTFYVSSYIAKSFIDEIIASKNPSKIVKLDHPIFVSDYDIERGNLLEIVGGIDRLM